MWPLVISLLTAIPGKLGDYFKQRNELEMQRLETDRQIEAAKQQMASAIAKAQLELNKTIVSATGAYFKYFTFFMWFGPFMLGTVWPSKASEIFINWAGMPDWYTQSCMLLMFTIWGISVSSEKVASIFTSLGNYMADRREYKTNIAAIKAGSINEQRLAEEIRKKLFPKGMTEAQWEAIRSSAQDSLE